jgi:Kyakuja-Dileera-Zisupton transposase
MQGEYRLQCRRQALIIGSRGDIHVSLDGNFSHRHLRRTVDEGKQYHVPPYYIGKEFVDNIGDAMAAAKAKPAKARAPKVPDEAVDGCEDGHIAGKGTNVKTSTQIYDDTGTMALCCRHDIPIFVANIDTPGEQQKYAVALLSKLFSLLPPKATVVAFYDVGCVLDRSLQTVSVLRPPGSLLRLTIKWLEV